MQNRVTVTVGGLKYTLLAVEDENYVHRVAAYVNEKLKETGRPKKKKALTASAVI